MTMNGALWMTEHSGKMTGINSIGTTCASNPWCIKRRENNESVCSKCYADTYMKMRKALKKRLEDNAEVLANRLLHDREIPVTNAAVFRFESFGDLHNTTHLENYILICNRNPYTHFGLWTKNTWILDKLFNKNGVSKPDNLSIIVSSPKLNTEFNYDKDRFWFIDHLFTVYDKHFIKDNNVEINCGSRDCLGCQKCYHRNNEFYIREKLK